MPVECQAGKEQLVSQVSKDSQVIQVQQAALGHEVQRATAVPPVSLGYLVTVPLSEDILDYKNSYHHHHHHGEDGSRPSVASISEKYIWNITLNYIQLY